MPILIDGYNLLFASGLLPRGVGPGTLERVRRALLNSIAAILPPEECRETIIVYDARDAPLGRADTEVQRGITIRFASGYEDADQLLEILIRSNSAPKRLTVVSSDRRVQVAARRRRATVVESEEWYSSLLSRRKQPDASGTAVSEKPAAPMQEEIAAWLAEFAADAAAELPERLPATGTSRPEPLKPGEETLPDEALNPFPPGYAEDLLDEDNPP